LYFARWFVPSDRAGLDEPVDDVGPHLAQNPFMSASGKKATIAARLHYVRFTPEGAMPHQRLTKSRLRVVRLNHDRTHASGYRVCYLAATSEKSRDPQAPMAFRRKRDAP
jgi:hypothetical protein